LAANAAGAKATIAASAMLLARIGKRSFIFPP
jgi:hypothetical protein